MNIICMIKGHDWFNEFMRPLANPDETVITGLCLRCGAQRPHIRIIRHWNSAGFYTYDVVRGVQFPPNPLPPHLQLPISPESVKVDEKKDGVSPV